MTCCLSLMDSLKSYCTDRYRNMYNHILPFVGRHDHKVLVVVRCMSTLIYLSINIKSTYIICWTQVDTFLYVWLNIVVSTFNTPRPKHPRPKHYGNPTYVLV